jgi:hypothetical protein
LQTWIFRIAANEAWDYHENRPSKQNLVFVGNVIPLTNILLNAPQNQLQLDRSAGFNGVLLPATNSQNNRLQPALFSNARITGTVTVDATNRIEINAVPIAP